MKSKHSKTVGTLLLMAVLSVGSACSKQDKQAEVDSKLTTAELLQPAETLDDVTIVGQKNIQLQRERKGTLSLSGNLEGKRTTVVLKPESGSWDISRYSFLRIDFVNDGPGLVWISARLDNPGAEDWHNSTSSTALVLPGEKATLGFAYPRAEEKDDSPDIFKGMFSKPNGYRWHWKPFDPENVVACRLSIESTDEKLDLKQLQISVAQPYGMEANAELLELPYLDKFGQVRQLEWPGKIHSEEELLARQKEEQQRLLKDPGPVSFNIYGGWKEGPKLEATGFFRTQKVDGKWWLVDPLGNLFFSQGANSVGYGQSTPLTDRGELFSWLPDDSNELMSGAVQKSKVNFMYTNLARTFGEGWVEKANARIHQRMRQYGLNTLAAWSSHDLVRDKKTPYTAILHMGSDHSPLAHGLSDPFSESFKSALERGLGRILGPEKSDPWCIGVFIDNEIGWTENIVHNALRGDPKQPVRLACLDYLKEKYATIGALNAAWASGFDSWEEMRGIPEGQSTDAFKADFIALKKLIADKYYKVCRDAMREILPNHLYLGSRMHNAPEEVLREAVKYVDVLSLNSYENLSGAKVPEWADLPCMDTEFHFGSPDMGVPGVGLRPAGDQTQRARAYVNYVVGGLKHPCVVGTHWFAWTDQSAAGRPGENYQIGFVDVTDSPYQIFTQASRALGENMYQIATNKEQSQLEAVVQILD